MIALSAVGCAMAAIAVVVQAYVPVSVALNVVAALFVALPLTRGYWGGALLAYVSAALIGFFTVNIQALPFILLFGPYTVVMWLLDFKFYEFLKLPKWAKIVIITLVKIGYFFLMFWACLQLMQVVVADIELFGFEWTYPVLYAVGFALFCLYDPLFRWVYRCMITLISRHVKTPPSQPRADAAQPQITQDVFDETDSGRGEEEGEKSDAPTDGGSDGTDNAGTDGGDA